MLLPEWLQNHCVRQGVTSLHKTGMHMPLEPWPRIHSNHMHIIRKQKNMHYMIKEASITIETETQCQLLHPVCP